MTKQDAIDLFDGNASALARALNMTSAGIAAWPDDLDQKRIDKIIGAVTRLNAEKQRRLDAIINGTAA